MVHLVRLDLQGLLARQDQEEMVEQLESQVQKDPLGPLDLLVNEVILVRLDRQVKLDLLVQLEILAQQDQVEHLEIKDQREILDHQDQLALEDHLDPVGNQDHLAHQGPVDHLVTLELEEMLVREDKLDLLVTQVYFISITCCLLRFLIIDLLLTLLHCCRILQIDSE